MVLDQERERSAFVAVVHHEAGRLRDELDGDKYVDGGNELE